MTTATSCLAPEEIQRLYGALRSELTTQVGTTLLDILERRFPYVDEFINRIPK